MKDYITITNTDNVVIKYEVVTIFTIKDNKYTYIIYKDLDNKHVYIAKYNGRKKVPLTTTLRDSEIKVGNIILKEVLDKTLEVDKSHKTANITSLRGLKNELSINLTGSTINLYLLSGSAKEKTIQEEMKEEELPKGKSIDIIDWYASEIKRSIGVREDSIITEETLKKVYTLDLRVSTSGDLSFLEKCTNLRSLSLNIYNNSGNLNSIDSLEELLELNINFIFNNGDINKHDFRFISNSPKLKKVTLIGTKRIESNILDKVQTLIIQQDGLINYKYKYLIELSELDFVKSSPYDIGISLTSKVMEDMNNKRVKVGLSSPEDLAKLQSINIQIDNILKEMDIKANGNKNSILSKIITYTLDNIQYNNKKSNDTGLIYNPLVNKIGSKEEIEAFMISLINRTNINTDTLYDYNKEWTKIRYNNEYYYLDPDWQHNNYFDVIIDDSKPSDLELPIEKKEIPEELIQAGVDTELDWFKNIPREVSKEEVIDKKEDIIDLSDKSLSILINEKDYSVSPMYLIAILDSIGLAINYLMNANDFDTINGYIQSK